MSLRLRKPMLIMFYSLLLGSCVTYKKVPLFQDMPQQGMTQEQLTNYSSLQIQPNDVLSITVSSLNPEASAMFNPPVIQQQSAGANSSNNPFSGFVVDGNGNIRMPFIDTVHIAGLTTTQARDLLTEKLKKYLKEPLVHLHIVNFKIGVFGDVNAPGLYTVPFERMTLMEAIITAGDLRIGGVRNNVLLIRETDGKRQFVRFDLNSKSTFASPYFYLKNNDLVYVQPGSARERKDNLFGNIGIATSLISLILILTRL